MNLQEYQKAASRTSSGDGIVMDKGEWLSLKGLNQGGRGAWRLANAMAVAAEAGELSALVFERESVFDQPTSGAAVTSGIDYNYIRNLVKKELGDIMWYAAEAASALGRDLGMVGSSVGSVHDHGSRIKNVLQVCHRAGEAADYFKKLLWHGKEPDWDRIDTNFGALFEAIEYVCIDFDLEFGEVLQANIDKLMLRYKEGFSAAASEARVDLQGT